MGKHFIPIRASTQQFTEIEDVAQNIIVFVDGSCALILSVTAVNFGLLSEKEQEAIIYAYAGILNSLSFPIQILIRSKHKDITAYLKLLEDKEKEVLDKKFYIIIPFSNLELGPSTSVLFGTKKGGLPYAKSYIIERALIALLPKRDHIQRLLGRLGLHSSQLTNNQLIQLFFSLYNPGIQQPTTKI